MASCCRPIYPLGLISTREVVVRLAVKDVPGSKLRNVGHTRTTALAIALHIRDRHVVTQLCPRGASEG
eukprot:scaffold433157_cov53-Prasinocladus_malaysianus.AAC.1